MKDTIHLIFHLLTTIAKMIRPGGGRAIIAENLLLKQQLLIHSRTRQRAPNLTTQDRTVHYKPDTTDRGPSWLTALGHTKDSLWSVDLFRAESITLKTHWIVVVMDQCTRRIIGFAVHSGNVDGLSLCRMFNEATSGTAWPERISTDNDPLYQYKQWKSNLRVLEIEEIKSLPNVPMSHPFVERLIGSVRRELLDQTFFWTATDLENKLRNYQRYYNEYRTHSGRNGSTPVAPAAAKGIDINRYRWESHCRGLFELPVAA